MGVIYSIMLYIIVFMRPLYNPQFDSVYFELKVNEHTEETVLDIKDIYILS